MIAGLAVLLLAAPAFGAEAEVFPFMPNASADSGAAVRALILDAPAGKYGPVIARDGNFVFSGTGERVKFWGVNMVFSANFPEKGKADALAEDFANMGINLVRLHGFDSADSASGSIFKDYTQNTKEISVTQLDKLDYFIFALKERGIYIDLNLNAKRRYAPGDGVDGDPALYGAGGALKSAQFFEPKLIELQKDFARDLLTHVNPYTKQTYASEPAIAMIELVNEQSLFTDWGGKNFDEYLSGAVSDTLDRLFGEWLEGKYQTIEKLNKAWGTRAGGFDALRWIRYSEVKKSPAQEVLDWSEFLQDTERGFFAEMSTFLKGELHAKQMISGNNLYAGLSDLAAQTEMDFTNSHAYFDHPVFPLGWSTSVYEMGNSDLLDQGLVKSKDKYDSFFAKMALTAMEGKPHVVSEWGHQFPNQYEYESPLLVASLANIQDWDAMILFAYSHDGKAGNGAIDYWFDMRNNPAKRAQMAAAALSFVRGDVAPAGAAIKLDYTKADTLHDGAWELYTNSLFAGEPVSPALLINYRLRRGFFDAKTTSDIPSMIGASAAKHVNDSVTFRSGKGQLLWTSGESAVIDTPRLQAFIGAISGKDLSASDFSLRLDAGAENDSAVSLTALDDADIRVSGHLLLTVAGRQANQGQRFLTGLTLSDWGSGFVNVWKIRGTAAIYADEPEKYEVYALREDGSRSKALPADVSGDAIRFSLGEETMWYEISTEWGLDPAGVGIPEREVPRSAGGVPGGFAGAPNEVNAYELILAFALAAVIAGRFFFGRKDGSRKEKTGGRGE
ncbi:MAG: beta-galactosidase [Clostridiales Family XIII bacterium]|jgi:hypothetical protein|nr:beta-galactosidase [Clostridiales Family XIII bacterium]